MWRQALPVSELAGGARIRHIYQDIFVKGLEELNPSNELSDEDIRTAIKNSGGVKGSLLIPEVRLPGPCSKVGLLKSVPILRQIACRPVRRQLGMCCLDLTASALSFMLLYTSEESPASRIGIHDHVNAARASNSLQRAAAL